MKIKEKYKNERKEVSRFMRRLYRQGLTSTTGGNISLRISDDIIVITPSASDKGRMKWKEVGLMTISGENLTSGANLLRAFDKNEVLENAAKMTLITEMTGKKKPLSKSRIIEIDRLFR